jgi:hypothetical protein
MRSTRPFNLAALPLLVFLFIRVPLLLALPYDGLRGYGDFIHFSISPTCPGCYLHYWAEFPPIFPFLSELLLALSGGQEHVYSYLLILLLFAADLGSLLLFTRLGARLQSRRDDQPPAWRAVIYAAILAGLAYSWWYFDSLAVFFTLLALELSFSRRSPIFAGGALALASSPAIPVLLLPAFWRWLPARRAAWISAAAAVLVIAVYGGLWAASPQYTQASLQSQSAKGSWETVWALLDGNLQTGNFGPEIARLDPATASLPMGNPPLIPPWASLIVFGAAGLLLWIKYHPPNLRAVLAFAGLTWVIFLLWSPGWSPQWVLYLLPLILLVIPDRLALLLTGALILVNLLEWPLMLSRGLFQALPLTIILRVLLLARRSGRKRVRPPCATSGAEKRINKEHVYISTSFLLRSNGFSRSHKKGLKPLLRRSTSDHQSIS